MKSNKFILIPMLKNYLVDIRYFMVVKFNISKWKEMTDVAAKIVVPIFHKLKK